jgi:RNA polymerase sigma factor (sigma-70 family)
MLKRKQTIFLDELDCHRRDLSNFCRVLCANTETAKDLMSEIIEIAWRNFDKIKDKKRFKSYLFTTASRTARVHWKYRDRHDFTHDLTLEKNDFGALGDTDLSFDIEYLYKKIRELPPEQSEAIILFEINGFSIKEIAELQNASQGAVKTRLKRGRESLKKNILKENNTENRIKNNLNKIVPQNNKQEA